MRIALVVVFALALAACGPRTDTLVCAHCYCMGWSGRDLTHPISCETLGRDIMCCMADSS